MDGARFRRLRFAVRARRRGVTAIRRLVADERHIRVVGRRLRGHGQLGVGGVAELVSSGGLSYGDTVYSGGEVNVYSGGVDSASVIDGGGKETVSKGGVTYDDTVASGGAQSDYGVTHGTTISLGGAEDVFSGAAADISQVYGSELVSSGGSIYADTVHSVGALTVSSGGSVSDGLTISGGYAGISGAVASGQEIRFAGAGDLAFYDLAAFHATIGAMHPATSSTLAASPIAPAKRALSRRPRV